MPVLAVRKYVLLTRLPLANASHRHADLRRRFIVHFAHNRRFMQKNYLRLSRQLQNNY